VRSEGHESTLGSFTDRYVFAAGPANQLWGELGFSSPPIMGVAGTSLTVPIPDNFTGPRPTRPLKLVDEHGGPVIIPLVDSAGHRFVRVGGYTAFAGEQPPQKDAPYAYDFLNRQYAWLERMYPELAAHFVAHELGGDLQNLATYNGSWVGSRPVTYDNHALVGPVVRSFRPTEAPSNVENGWLATGLGAAGFLGIGVADILAQQVANPEALVQVPGIVDPSESKRFMAMVDPARLERFRSPLPTPNSTAL
jgi:glycine/D-amino acid oxidase-like deaminating enzyme